MTFRVSDFFNRAEKKENLPLVSSDFTEENVIATENRLHNSVVTIKYPRITVSKQFEIIGTFFVDKTEGA